MATRLHTISTVVMAMMLVGCGMFPAQSLLVFEGQVVAATGQAVPGLAGGEVFGGSGTFDLPVLDDAGNVVFRGRFVGGSATPTTDRGYFLGSSASALSLVLQSGSVEPSGTVSGATLNTNTSTGLSGSIRTSGNGALFFGATLNGGGVTAADDTAIYVGTPLSLQILVREGGAAVGTTGASYSSSFSSPSTQLTSINNLGLVYFKSSLTGGDVLGTTNNDALFTGTLGALSLIARKGDLGLGGEQFAGVSSSFVGQLNTSGQVMFDVSYVVGTGTTPVTAASDRSLWIYTPVVGPVQVVREGDATPIPGTTFNNAADTWGINTGSTTFNASGQALIRADLAGAVTTGVDDSAVVLVSLAGHSVVVRRGDPAPGVAGANLDAFNNTSLQLDDTGRVAFQSSMVGSVTTTDDTGIWTGTAGNLTLVAREGDVAPGTGGATFGNTSGMSMQMNGAGQVIFNNTLVGGATPGSSLWSWDPVLGLQAVVLSGDPVEISPGVFETVTSSGGVQFSNGEGRPLSFANDGTVALRVGLTNGAGAIVKVRLGSLTGVPSTISTTAGGQQTLFLNAGSANTGFGYIVGVSGSGTTPGINFGGFNIPLNSDALFTYSLLSPNIPPLNNTLGLLLAEGRSIATIDIPAGTTSLAGMTIHFAYAVANAGVLTFASEAAALNFTL